MEIDGTSQTSNINVTPNGLNASIPNNANIPHGNAPTSGPSTMIHGFNDNDFIQTLPTNQMTSQLQAALQTMNTAYPTVPTTPMNPMNQLAMTTSPVTPTNNTAVTSPASKGKKKLSPEEDAALKSQARERLKQNQAAAKTARGRTKTLQTPLAKKAIRQSAAQGMKKIPYMHVNTRKMQARNLPPSPEGVA